MCSNIVLTKEACDEKDFDMGVCGACVLGLWGF